MTGQPVYIADYDPRWPATFRQIRDQIPAVVGPLALRVDHVGSTAVPGLAAKRQSAQAETCRRHHPGHANGLSFGPTPDTSAISANSEL